MESSGRVPRLREGFRNLRLEQLDRGLDLPVRKLQRPPKGWIRAIRQALGVSSGEMARRLGTSRQLPLQLEKGEGEDRITLKSLRAAANALDCDLVYAFVPRGESFEELCERRARSETESKPSAKLRSHRQSNEKRTIESTPANEPVDNGRRKHTAVSR
jgi:predicted DNA-binding mobile mystery protein A